MGSMHVASDAPSVLTGLHVCCAALGRGPALPHTQARERRPAAAALAGLDLGRVPLRQIVALASRRNSEAERARRDDLRRKARASRALSLSLTLFLLRNQLSLGWGWGLVGDCADQACAKSV